MCSLPTPPLTSLFYNLGAEAKAELSEMSG